MTDSIPMPEGVLIVDDDEIICNFFTKALQRGIQDIRIEAMTDGHEALDVFRSNPFKVVILDNHMPEMDGRDVYLAIEELCENESIPMPSVLFCTGYEPSSFITQTVEQNEKHHLLRKPVVSTNVIELVRSCLTDGAA
jgi:CheY-like chemotaxis protein